MEIERKKERNGEWEIEKDENKLLRLNKYDKKERKIYYRVQLNDTSIVLDCRNWIEQIASKKYTYIFKIIKLVLWQKLTTTKTTTVIIIITTKI